MSCAGINQGILLADLESSSVANSELRSGMKLACFNVVGGGGGGCLKFWTVLAILSTAAHRLALLTFVTLFSFFF